MARDSSHHYAMCIMQGNILGTPWQRRNIMLAIKCFSRESLTEIPCAMTKRTKGVERKALQWTCMHRYGLNTNCAIHRESRKVGNDTITNKHTRNEDRWAWGLHANYAVNRFESASTQEHSPFQRHLRQPCWQVDFFSTSWWSDRHSCSDVAFSQQLPDQWRKQGWPIEISVKWPRQT